jgi:hypothetical protein
MVQVVLACAAWADVARRSASQVRGPKWRWAMPIAVNYAGPLAYFAGGGEATVRMHTRTGGQ